MVAFEPCRHFERTILCHFQIIFFDDALFAVPLPGLCEPPAAFANPAAPWRLGLPGGVPAPGTSAPTLPDIAVRTCIAADVRSGPVAGNTFLRAPGVVLYGCTYGRIRIQRVTLARLQQSSIRHYAILKK